MMNVIRQGVSQTDLAIRLTLNMT